MKNNRFIIGVIGFILTIVVATPFVTQAWPFSNQTVIDTHWKFKHVVINQFGNPPIEGEVQSWKEYDDSDAIQVIIDGHAYYTDLKNMVLSD